MPTGTAMIEADNPSIADTRRLPEGDAAAGAPPRAYAWAMWLLTVLALGVIVAAIFNWAMSTYYGFHFDGRRLTWPDAWPQWGWDFPLGVAVVLAILSAGAVGGGRRLLAPSRRAWIIGIVALALSVRLACVICLPYQPGYDFALYHRLGVAMSQQWSLGPGETYRCFLPPVQVFSLGVMYRLFGPDPLYGQLLNVAYGTLTVVGLWYLGTRILGEHAGRLAALLGALLPSSVFACMLLGAEAPEVFWLVLALCLFVAGVEQRDKLWAAALCGLCLGVGALIRPTYLLIPAAMGLHLLLAGHRRARALAATAVIGLCTLAVVAPWTIRNYNVTGGLVIISSNGGGNLYSANNPDAHGGYTASAWDYLFHNCPDDLSLQRVGSQRAREWISRNKPRFAELCVARFFLFWEQDKECVWWAIEQPATDESNPRRPQMIQDRRMWTLAQLASDGFYFAAMLAALVGVVRRRAMWRTRHEWMILPILCAYFTAVHMVFESQGKYRYMLTPLMLLLAAAAIGRKDPAAEEARTMADR